METLRLFIHRARICDRVRRSGILFFLGAAVMLALGVASALAS